MKPSLPIRAAAVLLALLGVAIAPADGNRKNITETLAACAAFTPDGTSVAATIDGMNVSLEITDPGGRVSQLTLPLRYPTTKERIATSSTRALLYRCNVTVNRAGDLASIGIAGVPPWGRLQVAVADLTTLKWAGDWRVDRDDGFSSPALAGFLKGTSTLVVAGEPAANGNNGTSWGVLAVSLIDLNGKQLAPVHTLRYAEDGHVFHRFADASNNRLWVFCCEPISATMAHQPLCPIASMNLTGDQPLASELVPSMQGKKRTDFWFYPDTAAFPQPNMILFGDGTAVWRVNMQTQAIDRFALPHPLLPQFAQLYGAAAMSPDGRIVAVPLVRSRLAFPFLVDNYVEQGTDIAVVQVDPFRLVGILPHEQNPHASPFTVDHRQGRTIVLVYRKKRWERHELKDPPNA